MPIYEYRCADCHATHDALQKLSDAPLVDCPHCGAPALKKQISAAGFRLSGGGWYETDFKTGDKKKNLAGEGTAKPEAASVKTEAKSESKPTKTESAA